MANSVDDDQKPLKKIAEAFKDLANTLNSETPDAQLEVGPFSHACSLVSPLFGCLGIAFKFAEMDYVSKMMIDRDMERCVRKGGSHEEPFESQRGLDMVRVLFEQIIVTDGNSLKDPASTAYAQVFAPHHGWAIRKAVAAGMYALPTKAQLLKKLNEDETSAQIQMQNYIAASTPVILYVDKLFLSRELGLDW
ncbi:Accelerated cell death 11 [Camellia lanceoleosa]|uniref:Accelerated cell death 11 n=1 Tax=Camellia lanceoleosa TaxID=1840588 RepID=A0ACC0GEA7_9ERIC|nr:Accelerated cell death 11 [Camellia lanceoleosa]